jgi:ribosomal protein L16/L10AE
MAQIETAEQIAARQLVTAAAVLENRADLRTYPHVYLTVHGYGMVAGEGVRQVIAAAEVLQRMGFDLVTLSEIKNQVYAIVRRRSLP